MAVGIKDESFEELEDPTEEMLWKLFANQCPADLEDWLAQCYRFNQRRHVEQRPDVWCLRLTSR